MQQVTKLSSTILSRQTRMIPKHITARTPLFKVLSQNVSYAGNEFKTIADNSFEALIKKAKNALLAKGFCYLLTSGNFINVSRITYKYQFIHARL